MRVRDTGCTGVVVQVHSATQLDLLTPLEVQLEGKTEGGAVHTARLAMDDVMQPDDTVQNTAATRPQQQQPATIDTDRGGLRVQEDVPPSLVVGTNADAVRTMGGRRRPSPPPPPQQQSASFAAAAYGKLLPLWALDIVSSQVRAGALSNAPHVV